MGMDTDMRRSGGVGGGRNGDGIERPLYSMRYS